MKKIISLDNAFWMWQRRFPHRQIDFGQYVDTLRLTGFIIY